MPRAEPGTPSPALATAPVSANCRAPLLPLEHDCAIGPSRGVDVLAPLASVNVHSVLRPGGCGTRTNMPELGSAGVGPLRIWRIRSAEREPVIEAVAEL